MFDSVQDYRAYRDPAESHKPSYFLSSKELDAWDGIHIPRRVRSEHLIKPIDVLVVEDNPAFRRLVATALIDDGYEVLSAADGIDALWVLSHTEPWLLLLDMQLPRLDGRELMEEIRERKINIKVIIMTGTQDARRAASDLGADGYLAKPFDLGELSRVAQSYRLPNGPPDEEPA